MKVIFVFPNIFKERRFDFGFYVNFGNSWNVSFKFIFLIVRFCKSRKLKLLYTLDVENLKRIALGKSCPQRQKARAKLRVLKSDNFACVNCGSKKLTIHNHSSKRANGIRNASHYRLDECVTLCPKCHVKEHTLSKRREYVL